MTKIIVAAVLGFLTIPATTMIIWGAVEAGKLIATYGMESSHYWAGFFLLIGMFVVFLSSMPFWVN